MFGPFYERSVTFQVCSLNKNTHGDDHMHVVFPVIIVRVEQLVHYFQCDRHSSITAYLGREYFTFKNKAWCIGSIQGEWQEIITNLRVFCDVIMGCDIKNLPH